MLLILQNCMAEGETYDRVEVCTVSCTKDKTVAYFFKKNF